jgi:hypothetical protein
MINSPTFTQSERTSAVSLLASTSHVFQENTAMSSESTASLQADLLQSLINQREGQGEGGSSTSIPNNSNTNRVGDVPSESMTSMGMNAGIGMGSGMGMGIGTGVGRNGYTSMLPSPDFFDWFDNTPTDTAGDRGIDHAHSNGVSTEFSTATDNQDIQPTNGIYQIDPLSRDITGRMMDVNGLSGSLPLQQSGPQEYGVGALLPHNMDITLPDLSALTQEDWSRVSVFCCLVQKEGELKLELG